MGNSGFKFYRGWFITRTLMVRSLSPSAPESPATTAVTIQLGDLSISVSRASQSGSAGASSGAHPSPPPSQSAAADSPRQGSTFYLVYSCPRDTSIVGLHECTWPYFQSQLPGGVLFGSGASIKKFTSRGAAVKAWATRWPQKPLITHAPEGRQ